MKDYFSYVIIFVFLASFVILVTGCIKEPIDSSIPPKPDIQTFEWGNKDDVDQYVAWRHAILDEEARKHPKVEKRAKISFKRELTPDEFLNIFDQQNMRITVVYAGLGEFGTVAEYNGDLSLNEFLDELYMDWLNAGLEAESVGIHLNQVMVDFFDYLKTNHHIPLQGVDIVASATRLQELSERYSDVIRVVDLLEKGTFRPFYQHRPLIPGQ